MRKYVAPASLQDQDLFDEREALWSYSWITYDEITHLDRHIILPYSLAQPVMLVQFS